MKLLLGSILLFLLIARGLSTSSPYSHLRPFPSGRSLVYSYYAELKAGTSAPAEYASQYTISADLVVEPFEGDSNYRDSFAVALRNIKTRLYNGPATSQYEHAEYNTISTDAYETFQHELEHQFLIVFNASGKFEGVKLLPGEAEHSKNMKKAIVSLFQLNFEKYHYDLQRKNGWTLDLWSTENTIRGDCKTAYTIRSNITTSAIQSEEVTVTKIIAPIQCANNQIHQFDHYDYVEYFSADPQNDNIMDSKTVYRIKLETDNLLIKSITSLGGLRYASSKRKFDASYVLNNVSLILRENETLEPFKTYYIYKNIPLTTNLTYQRVKEDEREDFTMYPSRSSQSNLIHEIIEMMNTASDFITSKHLDPEEIINDHGHIINRIVKKMSALDVSSFEQLFNLSESHLLKEIFIETLPHVGTHASSLFIKNLIVEKSIGYEIIFYWLAKFPLNVRDPTYNLLREMEPLIHMEKQYVTSAHHNILPIAKRRIIYAEAMLSYASLIYQTFKNVPTKDFAADLLEYYISFFREHLISPDYTTKIIAIQALGNIGLGSANNILIDILYDVPNIAYAPTQNFTYEQILTLRIFAASCMKFTPSNNYNQLMPVIQNSSLPFELRIAAYDTVIRNFPEAIYELDSFIKHDEDEHLYNYHYMTVENLIKSANPHFKNLAKGISKNITVPMQLSYTLSGSHILEGIDEETGKGERFAVSYIVNQRNGFPKIVNFEHFVIDGRRWASTWRIQLVIRGIFEELLSLVFSFIYRSPYTNREDIRRLLTEASKTVKKETVTDLHAIITYKNRAIFTRYYNPKSGKFIIDDLMELVAINYAKDSRSFVFYQENSERQVVGEMGLPINIEHKIPFVTTLRHWPKENTKFEIIDFKIWRHGYHSMSIYNPFGHLWHEIKRYTTIDVQLPVTPLIINESPNTAFISHKLNSRKDITYGIFTYVSDAVAIANDELSILQRICPACPSHKIVKNETSERRNYEDIFDVGELGLQFSKKIFDCEKDYVHDLLRKDIIKALLKEDRETWRGLLTSAYIAARQYIRTLLPDPGQGTCGVIYKIEPSVKYPCDRADFNITADMNDTIENDKSLHILNAKTIKIEGTLGTNPLAANRSRLWNFNINIDMNKEHTLNTLNMKLNRVTTGEKQLTICVNTFKSYPEILYDPIHVGWMKEETTSRFEFSMANTEDGKCSRNDTTVHIRIKGELSEEQNEKFTRDTVEGACSADMRNPLFYSTHNTIPRTLNCLEHAIRYTTLRNYTVNVDYTNVPICLVMFFHDYGNNLKFMFLPRAVYKIDTFTLGTMKMNVIFPFKSSNDIMGIDSQSFPIHQRVGPDTDRDLWIWPLDNSRFPILFLQPYIHSDLRLCSVYPKAIRTLDGGIISYNVSSNWTLISADYVLRSYAVFTKSINNMMGWKIIAGSHEIELSPEPGESYGRSYTLTIDGKNKQLIELMAGTRIPNTNNWLIKITTYGSEFIIELSTKVVSIIYTFDSVTLVLSDWLQGRIVGLCGDMDGTHKTSLPEAYYLADV